MAAGGLRVDQVWGELGGLVVGGGWRVVGHNIENMNLSSSTLSLSTHSLSAVPLYSL